MLELNFKLNSILQKSACKVKITTIYIL